MEPHMGRPHPTANETNEHPTERHYRELLEQSESARNRGDHWSAQKFASEAHKWAMDERTRLQRLEQAREALVAATRRLESAWDKDRECQTIEELHERHPEFRSVITTWQKAQQLVQELEESEVCGEQSP
jgi:hypothetical protein